MILSTKFYMLSRLKTNIEFSEEGQMRYFPFFMGMMLFSSSSALSEMAYSLLGESFPCFKSYMATVPSRQLEMTFVYASSK